MPLLTGNSLIPQLIEREPCLSLAMNASGTKGATMDLGIRNRIALVTGGGRGIGRGVNLALAGEGVRVAINDIDPDRASEAAKEIQDAGGQAIAVVADVTDWGAVNTMVERVASVWGPVEILVNNAGIPTPTSVPRSAYDPAERTGGFNPFSNTLREEWDRVMNVITYGILNCSRAVLPNMIERHWGRIINISSDSGRVGRAGMVNYSMAKAGLAGFTKALAREMGRHSITVNCVSPGIIETSDWVRQNWDQLLPLVPLAQGANRFGQPYDIGYAVAFLASDRGEWITGQIISVNGGRDMPD